MKPSTATDKEVMDFLAKTFYYDNVDNKVKYIKDNKVVAFTKTLGFYQKGLTVKTHKYKLVYLHQIIYFLFTGIFNTDLAINHINGNIEDNNIHNLELVTAQEACSKRKKINKSNTSGVNGVSYSSARDKFEAKIKVSYKTIFIGRYNTLEQAMQARDLYIERHGLPHTKSLTA